MLAKSLQTLVLVNSASSGYPQALHYLLPMLDHLGVFYRVVDLMNSPIPEDIGRHPLVIVAHERIDPLLTRLSRKGLDQIEAAVRNGSGLVSFDPRLPIGQEVIRRRGTRVQHRKAEGLCAMEIINSHPITLRSPERMVKLAGTLYPTPLPEWVGQEILSGGGIGLVAARQLGDGRMVSWGSIDWMDTHILGPLGGLDGIFWRSLVWASQKPFVLRCMPAMAAMRVDDVAGTGELWNETPFYWVEDANRLGWKPWLGLFLYNLNPAAVHQLNGLVADEQVTIFPHALGRPPRTNWLAYYDPQAIATTRDDDFDQFIYYNHVHKRPWDDREAIRRLEAVDAWLGRNGNMKISPLAIGHYYEIGSNCLDHMVNRWGVAFCGKVMDINLPLTGNTAWLKSGPFRKYEKAGSSFPFEGDRSTRPVYYADMVNFAGYQLFNSLTEIRDDAGYEWAPDGDVKGSVERGVRQIRRAIDAKALAVLFTHETDYIYKIAPRAWRALMEGVSAGLSNDRPEMVTLEQGYRSLRAMKSSTVEDIRYDPAGRVLEVDLRGEADTETYFLVYSDDTMEELRIKIPVFRDRYHERIRL